MKQKRKTANPTKEQVNTNITLYKKTVATIDSLGHKDMPTEIYQEWVKSVDNEKAKEITRLNNNYTYNKFHYKMKTKILLTLLVISSFAAKAQNDNPYAIFGHKTNVLYEDKKSDLFRVKNCDTLSQVTTLAFDFQKHLIYLLDKNDSTVGQTPIRQQQTIALVIN